MEKLKFSDKIDLNLSLDNAATDVGLTYSVAPGSEKILAVSNASDSKGVVTPVGAGHGIVLVKDAANKIVKRIVVMVQTDEIAEFESELKAGTRTLKAATVKLANAKDTTPPVLADPTDLSYAGGNATLTFTPASDAESGIESLMAYVIVDGVPLAGTPVNVQALSSPRDFAVAQGLLAKTVQVTLVATNGDKLTTKSATLQVTVPALA